MFHTFAWLPLKFDECFTLLRGRYPKVTNVSHFLEFLAWTRSSRAVIVLCSFCVCVLCVPHVVSAQFQTHLKLPFNMIQKRSKFLKQSPWNCTTSTSTSTYYQYLLLPWNCLRKFPRKCPRKVPRNFLGLLLGYFLWHVVGNVLGNFSRCCLGNVLGILMNS